MQAIERVQMISRETIIPAAVFVAAALAVGAGMQAYRRDQRLWAVANLECAKPGIDAGIKCYLPFLSQAKLLRPGP